MDKLELIKKIDDKIKKLYSQLKTVDDNIYLSSYQWNSYKKEVKIKLNKAIVFKKRIIADKTIN